MAHGYMNININILNNHCNIQKILLQHHGGLAAHAGHAAGLKHHRPGARRSPCAGAAGHARNQVGGGGCHTRFQKETRYSHMCARIKFTHI